jgi:hypothetical protein
MKKAKPKYEEMQAKIFLLSEDLAKEKAALEKSRVTQQEQLDFICKLTGDAETSAIEFLARSLGKIVNVGTSNNMVSGAGNVQNSVC